MELSRDRIEWLEYDLLAEYPELFAGTFLRHGGASSGSYRSLNASESVGDHPDSVKLNREIIQKQVGTSLIVYAKQIHSTEIFEVTKDNYHKIPSCDALFTREKNLAIAVTHADCQGALFFDPTTEALAVVHSGWKGLIQNFYPKVVDYFMKTVHSQPSDLIVAISPSLSCDHAEFINYKTEIPKEFWDFKVGENHFDLKAIAYKQLTGAGIPDKNIEISPVCTFKNAHDYFSYRRDKICGRHATIMALKK
jgi:YfiH family protein